MNNIPRHLGLLQWERGKWMNNTIITAINPISFNWAVAFQNEVTVFSAPPASTGPDAEGAQRLGSSTAGQNTITSLLWVVWDGCTQPTAQSHPAPHVEPLACILVGTSAGYLQVHDSKGSVLFRQRLHGTAVQSMQLRTTSMGLSPCEEGEVVVCFVDASASISPTVLQSTLLACLQARAHSAHSNQDALSSAMAWAARTYGGQEVPPLPFSKWELRSARKRSDAVIVGPRPHDLYSVLQGVNPSESSTLIITAGERPCLSALDAQRGAGPRSTLSAVVGTATSLASGLWGVARTAREQVAHGPSALTQGLKSFIKAPLFNLPDFSKTPPQATYDDPTAGCGKGEPTPSVWRVFRDDARVVTGLVPAPQGPLILAPDNLGRVLLLDAAHMGVLHLWKG